MQCVAGGVRKKNTEEPPNKIRKRRMGRYNNKGRKRERKTERMRERERERG